MKVFVSDDVQKYWRMLCELYDKEQRKTIYSDIEMLIEKTALEKGVSLNQEDEEHRELNQKIANRYVYVTYGIAVYYLNAYPDSTEIPVVEFSYEELFQEEFKKEPADPEEQPG